MKYILLIIFSLLFSNENSNSFSDAKKTFSKNKFSKKENIYDKYDSLYVKYDSLYIRYNLLLKEIYSIRQSIYDLQDSTKIINKATIYTANNLGSDIERELESMIKSLTKNFESDILDNVTLMNHQDSVNASNINDVYEMFQAFQSAQKLKNNRLQKDNRELLHRVNALESEINELKQKSKK